MTERNPGTVQQEGTRSAGREDGGGWKKGSSRVHNVLKRSLTASGCCRREKPRNSEGMEHLT